MSLKDDGYYLVKADALPEIFGKVMQVKRLLSAGQVASVNEAVREVGISRSAYYKYRDSILPFYETSQGQVVTLRLVIENFPGILHGITERLAESMANVLTINQGIPSNGLADVSVSLETHTLQGELGELIADLRRINGVRTLEVLARQ